MKKKISRLALLLAILLLFLISACGQQRNAPRYLSAAAMSAQMVTPLPPVEDKSEIGSTNGIFIMGLVIVGISILPILLYKEKK